MGDVVNILKLPGGHELRVPDGETPQSAFRKHAAMSLAEGMCPHHGPGMEPVRAIDGRIGGHCRRCFAYWSCDPEGRAVGWDRDHDPHTGQPVIPGWVVQAG